MPAYAYLENPDLPCPECGSSLRIHAYPYTHRVKFWWGYCDNRSGYGSIYRVGDTIHWRPSQDGEVRGWAAFGGNSFNVGDPSVADLTVTDIRGELSQLPWTCFTCETAIGGAAIEIKGGIIVSVWVFLPGELESETYYLPQPDGSRLRMQEWENKASDHRE